MKIKTSAILILCFCVTITLTACSESNSADEIELDSDEIIELSEVCNPLFGNCEADGSDSCIKLNAEITDLETTLNSNKQLNETRLDKLEASVGEVQCPGISCRKEASDVRDNTDDYNDCMIQHTGLTSDKDSLKEQIEERKVDVEGKISTASALRDEATKKSQVDDEQLTIDERIAFERCDDAIETVEEELQNILALSNDADALNRVDFGKTPERESVFINISFSDDEKNTPTPSTVDEVETNAECSDLSEKAHELRVEIANLTANNDALDADLEIIQGKIDTTCNSDTTACQEYSIKAKLYADEAAACHETNSKIEGEGGEIASLNEIISSLEVDGDIDKKIQTAIDQCTLLNKVVDAVIIGVGLSDKAKQIAPRIGSNSDYSHHGARRFPDAECGYNSVMTGLGTVMDDGVRSIIIQCSRWSENSGVGGDKWGISRGKETHRADGSYCPSGYAVDTIRGISRKGSGLGVLTFDCVKTGANGVELIGTGKGPAQALRVFPRNNHGELVVFGEREEERFKTPDARRLLNSLSKNRCPTGSIATGIHGYASDDRVYTAGLICRKFERDEYNPATEHITNSSWQSSSQTELPVNLDELIEGAGLQVEDIEEATAESSDIMSHRQAAMIGIRLIFNTGSNRMVYIAPAFNRLSSLWKSKLVTLENNTFGINGKKYYNKTKGQLLCPLGHVVTGISTQSISNDLSNNIGIRCSPIVQGGLADIDKSIWTHIRRSKDAHRSKHTKTYCGNAKSGLSKFIATGLIGNGKTAEGGRGEPLVSGYISPRLGIECSTLSGKDHEGTDIPEDEYQRRLKICKKRTNYQSHSPVLLTRCMYNEDNWNY